MPSADLALLIDAAQSAGDIACGYFQSDPRVWDKADNQGPVTEADLAVDAHLQEKLINARPSYGWLSEESEAAVQRLACKDVFIVDPIDGTRAFIAGKDTWAISVAIATAGQSRAACVYLPARGILYAAETDGGATLNGKPIHVTGARLAERPGILAAKWNYEKENWPGGIPNVERLFRSSLAYRMAAVAEGKFDGMLTLRPTWDWDIAAGSLIVSEAGGTATDRTGAPLLFNQKEPQQHGALAMNPALHAELLALLTAKPA